MTDSVRAAPRALTIAAVVAALWTALPAPAAGVEVETGAARWAQADPADSLYRAARESLNRGDYAAAARAFARIPGRYPTSSYAGDALYWFAFTRYRMGGSDAYHAALEALARQGELYPHAATRGDAKALAVRIQGELARTGDAAAAAAVASAADVDATESRARIREQLLAAQQANSASAREARRRAVEAGIVAGSASEARIAAGSASAVRVRSGLSDGCERDDYEVRSAALNALAQMNAARALPVLKGVVAQRDSCSTPLRRTALFLLAQQGSSDAVDVVIDAAQHDPDEAVRRQAVFALAQAPSQPALAALSSILRGSNDVDMQGQALFALAQRREPEASAIIRGYVTRTGVPEELRVRAILALSQRPGPADAELLRGLFAQASSMKEKQVIIQALGQMDSTDNGRWLLAIARDRKNDVALRRQALFMATQRHDDIGSAELAALYEAMPEREMRQQLIMALSQRRDMAAVDKLIDIVRTEKDVDLRKMAIFWLGRSPQADDPRVVQLLQDIISH